MITLKRFRRIEAAVRAAGYGEGIEWTEKILPPKTPEDLAREAAFVICSSGMAASSALAIFTRVTNALSGNATAASVYGHPGKAAAIDEVWRQRDGLFAAMSADDDLLAFCGELPWIGAITRYHLAKNLGLDVAKPDIHLARIAEQDGVTPQQLCDRLGRQTGYRAATIDTILWRACAERLFDSAHYAARGWTGAMRDISDL